jgi:lipopolysaccharide/colanic/teichoic acid biosynthesis glycosyltransferase
VTRGEVAFAIIFGLLVNEVTDICPWLATRLVRWAARLRYPHAPERAATRAEELAALINDCPGNLFKLLTAVGFALHALVVLRRNQQPVGLSGAVKRAVDVGVAAAALMLMLPLWLVIALAIRLTSRGPIFSHQERVTKGGRVFRMYQFGTMRTPVGAADATTPLFKLVADQRLSRVERFLRWTGMKELPLLWNVLKGEMTLVGPRPPSPNEVALYEDWQLARLEVRAGITGLWQVSGRSDLSFDEYVRLDLFYIQNWSLAYDLYILARTTWILARTTWAGLRRWWA